MLLAPATSSRQFDVLSIWPLLLQRSGVLSEGTWALGHALSEYWVQPIQAESRIDLNERYQFYLKARSA